MTGKRGTKRPFPFAQAKPQDAAETQGEAGSGGKASVSYSPLRKKAKTANGRGGRLGGTGNGVGGGRMMMRQVGGRPVKKLVIKGFSSIPSLPSDFTEKTWKQLKSAVDAIHEEQEIQDSKEALYGAVRNLCSQDKSRVLYEKLLDTCSSHLVKVGETLKAAAIDGGSEKASGGGNASAFLDLVASEWKKHCSQMLMIRNIFLFLDRSFVLQQGGEQQQQQRGGEGEGDGDGDAEMAEAEGQPVNGGTRVYKSLWDMGLRLFHEKVLPVGSLALSRTTDGILSLIRREREGEAVDRSLLHTLVRMLSATSVYEACFEAELLEQTRDFYAEEGKDRTAHLSLPEYLRHAKKRLTEESERADFYLEQQTKAALLAEVDAHLVEAHYKTLLSSGIIVLFEDVRIEDLKRLHGLLERINRLDELKRCYNAFIKTAGVRLLQKPEAESYLVTEMLDFKARCDRIVVESFGGDEEFTQAARDGFEYFLNRVQRRTAELMAKFIDGKLKAGNKNLGDEALEALLDRVMILFRLVQSKDVFQAFFRTDLAKRLLLGKSASMDLEKTMIAKLKQECGASFTSKLEGMFTDMTISKEIMTAFRDDVASEELQMDLTVSVLTMGVWPTYPVLEVTLPPEMLRAQNAFKAFYLRKYEGRRLTWQNTMGHCVVLANFTKGAKELALSQSQTLVLLTFNEAVTQSFEEIEEATGCDKDELKTTLQSLACGKLRVLRKSPKGREVEEGDRFMFNHTFTHKRYRVKINAIQAKEMEKERDKTNEHIFLERQMQVDAAIVRIMKTRKSLSHANLTAELFKHLRFPATPKEIKPRIESLIDREFLERSAEDPQKYVYLA